MWGMGLRLVVVAACVGSSVLGCDDRLAIPGHSGEGGSGASGGAPGAGGHGGVGGQGAITGTSGAGGAGIGGTTGYGGFFGYGGSGGGGTNGFGGAFDAGPPRLDALPSDPVVFVDLSRPDVATAVALCSVDGGRGTNLDVAMFTAEQFCSLFIAVCGPMARDPSLKVMGSCMTTYDSWSSGASFEGMHGQQGCRSYHLCNAVNTNYLTVHCPHAEGLANATADAGTGPCP